MVDRGWKPRLLLLDTVASRIGCPGMGATDRLGRRSQHRGRSRRGDRGRTIRTPQRATLGVVVPRVLLRMGRSARCQRGNAVLSNDRATVHAAALHLLRLDAGRAAAVQAGRFCLTRLHNVDTLGALCLRSNGYGRRTLRTCRKGPWCALTLRIYDFVEPLASPMIGIVEDESARIARLRDG